MGSSRFRQTRPSIEAATLATTRLLSATLKCLDAAKAMAADLSKRFPADLAAHLHRRHVDDALKK
jgi:predicted hotdog family 3-hydroxylacyl-ACP dehydratase